MGVVLFPARSAHGLGQRYLRVAPEKLADITALLPPHVRVTGSREAFGSVVLVLAWAAGEPPPPAVDGHLEVTTRVDVTPNGKALTLLAAP